jgi:hypothetical protein
MKNLIILCSILHAGTALVACNIQSNNPEQQQGIFEVTHDGIVEEYSNPTDNHMLWTVDFPPVWPKKLVKISNRATYISLIVYQYNHYH